MLTDEVKKIVEELQRTQRAIDLESPNPDAQTIRAEFDSIWDAIDLLARAIDIAHAS